ncbi:MAG TPA: hypothetical protein VFT19_08510 [Solirubrobacterales bacterium]|nr:hypothetical protein [Solirubrobacterales bacterium]
MIDGTVGQSKNKERPGWLKSWLGNVTDAKQNVKWRRQNMRAFQLFFLLATAVMPLLAAVWFLWLDRPSEGAAVAIFAYFQLFFLAGFVTCRAQARDLGSEYRTMDLEDKILPDPPVRDETDSMLLFLKNEVELKRYYDQALRQSSFVFVLGVVCVLAGLAVVVGAGKIVYSTDDLDKTAQVVVGALGVAGGLLSGFVAQVYLGLHRGTVSSMTDFHTRFVLTHHMLFANVLVARIGDERLRDDALSDVANAIAADGSVEASNSHEEKP